MARHAWSLALLAGADIPFSILLGLLGALRSDEDNEQVEQLGTCILRVLSCVFALVGGVAALSASLGATRAGFWRVYVHEHIARARAVALLGALAFHLVLDRLSPAISTDAPSSTSLLDAPTTSFLAVGAAAAAYAKLYNYFLSYMDWYTMREAGMAIHFASTPKAPPLGISGTISLLHLLDCMLDTGVFALTLLLGLLGDNYGMLNPGTLCLLQAAGVLLFCVHLPLLLWIRKSCKQYSMFLLAYSVILPMRSVVASFTVAALAWSVLDDTWARGCAGGVLVVEDTEECMSGLWVRIIPLGIWLLVLAHAAFTISTLNAYTAFTQQRASFIASLRELNREFCRLARSEGVACCIVEQDVELNMDMDGEFVLVVDAGQGAREMLVRGRNLEAEVAALELERIEEECEEEDGPLLGGP